MNKEQQELLGDAYKNYLIEDAKVLPNMSKEKMTEMGLRLTQEEFINKCKTDTDFSERWGLKIEERELSDDERRKIVLEGDPHGIQSTDNWTQQQLEDCKKQLDEWNIPTKLITIIYNNKIIESYE
jgi:hypothetical protein